MFHTEISRDLKDVLGTLHELKRAVEQQVAARAQLAAENAVLSRRLVQAQAAEQHHKFRAAASRAVAMRAQVCVRSVTTARKVIARQKRELAAQRKKYEKENKALEEKISALEKENARLKEEAEGATAAAALAMADIAQSQSVSYATVSQAAHFADSAPSHFQQDAPQVSQSAAQPSNFRPGTSLWTRSGSLVWNPPSVNLSTAPANPWRARSQSHTRGNRPVISQAPAPVVTGFQTARQLIASQRQKQWTNDPNQDVNTTTCSPTGEKNAGTKDLSETISDADNVQRENQGSSRPNDGDNDCVVVEDRRLGQTDAEEEKTSAGIEDCSLDIPERPVDSEEKELPAFCVGQDASMAGNDCDVAETDQSSSAVDGDVANASPGKTVNSTPNAVEASSGDVLGLVSHKKPRKKKLLYSGSLQDHF